MKGRGLTIAIVVVFLAVCGIVIGVAMNKTEKNPGAVAVASASIAASAALPVGAPKGPAVDILVSSSDGKKEWLEEVTKAFHASGATAAGQPIRVKLLHMKSGESLQNIIDGKEKPVLWSPASASWLDVINAKWKDRTGHPFVEAPKRTVMSGLVIAMWEPMARALGWPQKAIGWEEVFKVALDPKGWGSYGHAEWGTFRFGHGHPDYSTSAALSVISSIYAVAGKTAGLTVADMQNPKVVEKVGALEKSIVHYGESSSWLTEKLCTKGPAYLSAVTLYESSVVAANDKYQKQLSSKLVAIYPKEGTYWEDHPTGVVNADWVTPAQKEAGEKFLAFITAREQQQRAITYGYRPTDATIPLASPIDDMHGADPKEVGAKKLEYVSDAVFHRANELWHQVKKHSTVILVLDTSGSMQGKPMNAAKKGAAAFIRAMEKDDEIAVMVFSSNTRLLKPLSSVREAGEPLASSVEAVFAEGGTALYDATIEAMGLIEQHKKGTKGERLYGVVLLTDGKDTSSKHTMSDLMDLMPGTEAADGTRIFTVAYGEEADKDTLRKLANRSNARFMEGTADNIDKVYHQISAYF